MADRRKSSDLSIADYIQAARFHPWAVVLPMVVIGVLAWLLMGRTAPVYESKADVQVGETEAQRSFDQDRGNDPELANERRFAKSDTVLDELRVRLGPGAPDDLDSLGLDVEIDDTADILVFSAKASSAAEAADRANLYANVFVDERRQAAVAGYRGAIELIEQELEDIRTERIEVRADLDEVIIQLAPLDADSPQRPLLEEERATLESRLAPQLTFLDNQEAAFIENLSSLRISQSLAQTGTASVASMALPETDPLPNAGTRALVIGELVGLIMGLILAVTIHNMDDKIREPGDVERYFPDLPVLGAIPYENAVRKNRELTVLAAPHSSFAESIYQVRTSLRFMTLEQGVRLVVVTSANPSEGKTTFTSNFAWALAGLGEPVVFIDGDLRRPVGHEHFGVEIAPGLTDLVIDSRPLSSVSTTFLEQDGKFSIVPAGTHHGNPADFMGSSHLVEAVKAVAADAMTVVDAAPVLPVSDSRAIAGASDLTIVMVRIGSTRRSELEQAIRNLRNAGATSIALVIVGVKPESSSYYRSGEKPTTRGRGPAHPSPSRPVEGAVGAIRPRPAPVTADSAAARPVPARSRAIAQDDTAAPGSGPEPGARETQEVPTPADASADSSAAPTKQTPDKTPARRTAKPAASRSDADRARVTKRIPATPPKNRTKATSPTRESAKNDPARSTHGKPPRSKSNNGGTKAPKSSAPKSATPKAPKSSDGPDRPSRPGPRSS